MSRSCENWRRNSGRICASAPRGICLRRRARHATRLGVSRQLVQETAALAGITKRVSPHLLRHSVATTLLERGMPLEQIQKFLGHARIETTQVYAESTTAMIQESYHKALSG
jgi:site-specific recombinase XerD